MFRLFCTFVAFVFGGWFALRSDAVADFVNKAAVELMNLFSALKEAIL